MDLRILRLRQKIEPDPAAPAILRTVRGEGYAFVPD
jgi:two-component system, OmpR family, response regulator